jgi:hypothetical protein
MSPVGTKRTCRLHCAISALRDKAENIYSHRAFPVLTQLRHSVTLRAPHECADTYYLMSGRKVSVPPDRLVAMTVEDSKPLLSIGWTTQNNLEIR